MMNPILSARLRAQWPVALVAAVLIVFVAMHALVQAPLQNRFQTALRRAGNLGAVLDPRAAPSPPRCPRGSTRC